MQKITKILGIDPATHCGWSLGPAIGGTWDLSIRRDESAGMRLVRLRAKLSEVYAAEKFDLIAYEAARHAAPTMQGALVVQAELQSVIKLWAEDNHVQIKPYSPSEVKKLATGKGNAAKAKMLEAAAAHWPQLKFVDDNHVDATFIWLLASNEYLNK